MVDGLQSVFVLTECYNLPSNDHFRLSHKGPAPIAGDASLRPSCGWEVPPWLEAGFAKVVTDSVELEPAAESGAEGGAVDEQVVLNCWTCFIIIGQMHACQAEALQRAAHSAQ